MPTAIAGLDNVRRALQETPKEARAVLRDVMATRIRVLAQRTQQAAPMDTGALRAAITGVAPKGRGLTATVQVQSGTFFGRIPQAYVLSVEYGKYGRPFIRSTAERETAPFIAAVRAAGQTLERNIETIGGRFL